MFNSVKYGVYVLMSMIVAFATAHAERLEPVLRAWDVRGTVMVQRGGHGSFEEMKEGRTYPYGSRFRTSAESSVRLAMSEESSVRLLQNAEILFAENRRDTSKKRVILRGGEIEANLGPNFPSGNNELYVEAANFFVKAVGSTYRVALATEADLNILIIRVFAGLVRVMGANFEVAELQADQWVSLLAPSDESFTRLKNLRGEFEVTVIDADKQQRLLSTEEGTVLKIWQRIVPETGERVVQVVLTDPQERMVETISVTFGPGEFAEFLAAIRDEYDDDYIALIPAPSPTEAQNPMPPDDFMDELVARTFDTLSPDIGVRRPIRPRIPEPPPPPVTPTPTPVGFL